MCWFGRSFKPSSFYLSSQTLSTQSTSFLRLNFSFVSVGTFIMPYLYSPELDISDCSPTRQSSIDEQAELLTNYTTDLNYWLKEMSSWAPTTHGTSSAQNANMHLGDDDVKPFDTLDPPLALHSRILRRSSEGDNFYRRRNYWSGSVSAHDSNEWMREHGTDTRKGAEAEDAGILGFGKRNDVSSLGTIKGGARSWSDAVQRSEGVHVPVDGHWMPGGGNGMLLLRWMMQSTELDPWHLTRMAGTLQKNELEGKKEPSFGLTKEGVLLQWNELEGTKARAGSRS
jgi:hypothetical protein